MSDLIRSPSPQVGVNPNGKKRKKKRKVDGKRRSQTEMMKIILCFSGRNAINTNNTVVSGAPLTSYVFVSNRRE